MVRENIMLAGKILLVDDMRLNRLVLGRMLQKLGFEVVEAENGLAAIEQWQIHGPALSCLLLDLQMPVLDGWETAKRLRGLEARLHWSRVPIVACTALGLDQNWHGHNTVTDSALSCGVDDLLEKMPSMAQLVAVLGKYVASLRGSQTPPVMSPKSQDPEGLNAGRADGSAATAGGSAATAGGSAATADGGAATAPGVAGTTALAGVLPRACTG